MDGGRWQFVQIAMLKTLYILFAILFGIETNAMAATCSEDISIGFFNGVNTELNDAAESLNTLGRFSGFGKSKRVLFYNTSAGLAFDLIEVFDQRLKEAGPGYDNRFEYFDAALHGDVVAAKLLTGVANPTLTKIIMSFPEDSENRTSATIPMSIK